MRTGYRGVIKFSKLKLNLSVQSRPVESKSKWPSGHGSVNNMSGLSGIARYKLCGLCQSCCHFFSALRYIIAVKLLPRCQNPWWHSGSVRLKIKRSLVQIPIRGINLYLDSIVHKKVTI